MPLRGVPGYWYFDLGTWPWRGGPARHRRMDTVAIRTQIHGAGRAVRTGRSNLKLQTSSSAKSARSAGKESPADTADSRRFPTSSIKRYCPEARLTPQSRCRSIVAPAQPCIGGAEGLRARPVTSEVLQLPHSRNIDHARFFLRSSLPPPMHAPHTVLSASPPTVQSPASVFSVTSVVKKQHGAAG